MTPIDGQEPRKFGTGEDAGATSAGSAAGGPPRRRHGEPEDPGRLRTVDAAARARLVQTVAWAALPGLVFGVLVGVGLAGRVAPPWKVPAFLVGFAVPFVAIVGFTLLVTSGAGRVAGTLHAPSGHGGRPRRPYSLAEAMVHQGRPEQAAALYELLVAEHPDEAEAYLRLARLQRDELGRAEEAARWFRRARERARLNDGQARLVARELIELYRHRLGDPVRAAPELARLAETLGDTPEGARAREELAEVKRILAEREGRGGGAG